MEKLRCSATYRETSISTTVYVADSHLNLLDLDCLGQLSLLDQHINALCNHAHSATSITSFTAEVMVRRLPGGTSRKSWSSNHY
ncbi:unnamed protein product [Hymenolepis diminuta]|uniref:Uncharacterized protein n=1 Tax=Hymenolepis diminuta TaxID=6216 RepID=A0A0R3SSL7_HYMDI|nr:unnamed protein product [Hymenolepis diminuta]VUZ44944.1 unnamed protein product [Hymenolepis diminuta]